MEESPPLETNSHSPIHEIPHLLWEPNFITLITKTRQRHLSWARWIQPIPSHSISL